MIRKEPPPIPGGGLPLPKPGPFLDEHQVYIKQVLSCSHSLILSKEKTYDAVCAAARKHVFHPVRDYLHSVRWDGKPRLDRWLIDFCGATESPYTRAVGAKTLIGAVARVRAPGCKLDTMLILEGPQGSEKSRLLRALAREWFRERLPSLDNKDAMIHLQGAWIIEWGELSGLSKFDVTQVKEFLVVQRDHFRAPYDKVGVDHARQCIFIGTTNDDTYLRDDTGNRRFWPVRVAVINLAAFKREVDQLWAEADARYQRGESWWLDTDLERAAREEQRARKVEDPWQPAVDRYVEGKDWVTAGDVLATGLHVPLERQDQRALNRVVACLKSRRWSREQKRIGGKKTWGYSPSTATSRAADEGTDGTATTATNAEEQSGGASEPWGSRLVTTPPLATGETEEFQEGGVGRDPDCRIERVHGSGKGGEVGGATGGMVATDGKGMAI